MSESLKIKEDVKREVLKYFTDSTEKQMILDNFTITNIAKATGEKEERIEGILSELEDEDLITGHDVSLKIYLPNVEKGQRFLKEVASRKVLSYSLYWLFLVSLAILWIAIPNLELQLPSGVQALPEMYVQGVQNGIVYSAIVGLVGSFVFDKISRTLVKWRWVSPQSYDQISQVIKIGTLLLIPSLLVFVTLSRFLGTELASAKVTIFVAVLAVAVAYVQLVWRKSE